MSENANINHSPNKCRITYPFWYGFYTTCGVLAHFRLPDNKPLSDGTLTRTIVRLNQTKVPEDGSYYSYNDVFAVLTIIAMQIPNQYRHVLKKG